MVNHRLVSYASTNRLYSVCTLMCVCGANNQKTKYAHNHFPSAVDVRSLQFWWINYVYAINKSEVKQSANRFLWHFHWNRTHFGCWQYQTKWNHWQKRFIQPKFWNAKMPLYVMLHLHHGIVSTEIIFIRVNASQHQNLNPPTTIDFETVIWHPRRIMLTFCEIPSCEFSMANIQLNFTNRLSILCYLTATTNWHFL